MRDKLLWSATYHRSLFFYLFSNCCSLNTTIGSSRLRWGGWIFLLLKCRLFIVSTRPTSTVTLRSTASCWPEPFKGLVEIGTADDFMLRWLLLWLLLLGFRFLTWHVWRLRWVQGGSVWRWTMFAKRGIIISRWLVPKKFKLILFLEYNVPFRTNKIQDYFGARLFSNRFICHQYRKVFLRSCRFKLTIQWL